MNNWVVVELPKGEMEILVTNHKSLSDARDDFLDRYNDLKSRQTVLEFELSKDGDGFFESDGSIVWITESVPSRVPV